MCKIFYGDREIRFSHDPDPDCDAVLVVPSGEKITIAKMLENLENNNTLCVKAGDPREAFDDFRTQFTAVEAVGGVVENPRGDTLMILRNGRWDLPKGHLERGETPIEGAMREVREETGLTRLETGEMVVATLHFYRLGDDWQMKHTRWYAMRNDGEQTTPQQEEGITRAEWIPRDVLQEHVATSYPSIKEVFKNV